MKDSNAAPSPRNSPDPKKGQVAAPKARTKAVANARSRAKTKKSGPQVAAPGLTPVQVAPKIAELKNDASASVAPEIVPVPVTRPEVAENKPAAAKPAAAKPAQSKPVVTKVAASQSTPAQTKPGQSAPKASPTQTAASPAPAKGAAPALAVSATVLSKGGAPKTAAPQLARKSRKLRPFHIVGIVALVALTGVAGASVGTYNSWANSQQIAPNVSVAGQPIGGMTRDEATAHLKKRFGKLAFTLQTESGSIVLGLADVGGQPSVEPTVAKAFAIGREGNALDNFTRVFGAEVKPRAFMLPIEWNRGALTSRLAIVNKQYARPAVDARLVTVSGAAPRVTGEASGRVLDVSATADAIQKSYFLGLSNVQAATREVRPTVLASDLAGRDVQLGYYRTEYNGGIAGRTTNIHVACRAIDGQVLMPGDILSFNGLTGERTYKKGYRMAHIFVRERGQSESSVVDGLAGGVCQVSSTLYNAVRKVNSKSVGRPLEIVERNSHSLPVTYVPSGRDATVAWPHKDFKFRNENSFPVYVRTNVGNGRLTISIWGRVPDGQAMPVSLEN